MGRYLSLHDVASGHPVAEGELAELILAEKRYNKLRIMNPREFTEIWRWNLDGQGNEWNTFDGLVDQYNTGGTKP